MASSQASGLHTLTLNNEKGSLRRRLDATTPGIRETRNGRAAKIQLQEWKDLPPWRQLGSEHLQTGYRPNCDSLTSCLRSLSYVHNETVNIFSHLIGAALFLLLPIYVFKTDFPPRWRVATTADIVVCSIYFLSVGICFVFSALFHTFMCHSEPLYSLLLKVDVHGVLLLMWGANFPLIHYSLPCSLGTQIAYWTVNTTLATLCSLATGLPSIGAVHLGNARAALFSAFGSCSVIFPVLLGVIRHGFEEQNRRVGLAWILLTALFNGTAVIAYAIKFPERWYPRKFDICGASHQLLHILVGFAALSYAKAMLQAFDYHHEYVIDTLCR
ncbi:hypothetical protein M426DRAFT_15710 [Hypoxylon sp. CI-4A]|nr:hypothetical protein M426DRAFT_15710 [Hypoxylon sp. CI-4A]